MAALPDNTTLQGSYFFRYLGVDISGAVDRAVSAYGSITFDGAGKYTISGSKLTSSGSGTDTPTSLTGSGTYGVLSSGLAYLVQPVTSDTIYVGIGSGQVVVGSSTESAMLDLFVAVPASNNNASNSTLNGSYYVSSMEFLGGNFNQARNTFFPLASGGSGSLGSLQISGFANNVGSAVLTQGIAGATYSIGTNGSGTMTLPAPSGVASANVLISGAKNLYVSPDGNFFIAGGTSAYDFVVGVKALSGAGNTTPLSGLYFTGTMAYDLTQSGGGPYASQGVSNEASGTELGYERANDSSYGIYDYTYSNSFTFSGSGTVAYTYDQYAAGANGNVVIGSGKSGYYFLNVYVKAPVLTGSGVFLNPQGIVNTASYAPFEAQVAPGEFLTLFGSGLSNSSTVATSLPLQTNLGGVQVSIGGNPMALYQVSPTAIAGIVPYNIPTDGSLISVQVNNNGTLSNTAMLYTGTTSPGAFTLTQNGVGDGAILHGGTANAVTTSSPAKPGEVLSLFLSGLGPVSPAVQAGAAGPSSPLSYLVSGNLLGVFIDGIQATVNYQGLAPGLAGLYQLNVTVPSNVTAGTSVDLDIETIDASNVQATIPISK